MIGAIQGKVIRTYSNETQNMLLLRARDRREHALTRMKERQDRRIAAMSFMQFHAKLRFTPVAELTPVLEQRMGI